MYSIVFVFGIFADKRMMVVVESMIPVTLERCIELFAIAGERVEVPR